MPLSLRGNAGEKLATQMAKPAREWPLLRSFAGWRLADAVPDAGRRVDAGGDRDPRANGDGAARRLRPGDRLSRADRGRGRLRAVRRQPGDVGRRGFHDRADFRRRARASRGRGHAGLCRPRPLRSRSASASCSSSPASSGSASSPTCSRSPSRLAFWPASPVHIVVSQAPALLGVPDPPGSTIDKLVALLASSARPIPGPRSSASACSR